MDALLEVTVFSPEALIDLSRSSVGSRLQVDGYEQYMKAVSQLFFVIRHVPDGLRLHPMTVHHFGARGCTAEFTARMLASLYDIEVMDVFKGTIDVLHPERRDECLLAGEVILRVEYGR